MKREECLSLLESNDTVATILFIGEIVPDIKKDLKNDFIYVGENLDRGPTSQWVKSRFDQLTKQIKELEQNSAYKFYVLVTENYGNSIVLYSYDNFAKIDDSLKVGDKVCLNYINGRFIWQMAYKHVLESELENKREMCNSQKFRDRSDMPKASDFKFDNSNVYKDEFGRTVVNNPPERDVVNNSTLENYGMWTPEQYKMWIERQL